MKEESDSGGTAQKKTLPYLTIFSVDPIHIHLFEL